MKMNTFYWGLQNSVGVIIKVYLYLIINLERDWFSIIGVLPKKAHRGEAELRINCEQKKSTKENYCVKKFQIFTEISQFSKYTNCVKKERNVENDTLKTRLKAANIVQFDSFLSKTKAKKILPKPKISDFHWIFDNFNWIRIMAKIRT